MAARQYAISVGTSAVALEGTQFRGWLLRNLSTVTIYVGDLDVLTSTGFPVDAGVTFSPAEIAHGQLDEKTSDLRLWAIAGTASNDVRVLIPGRA